MTLNSFRKRYEYLRLGGKAGKETFGFERYLNQRFYCSQEWRTFRRDIIVRDSACDLAIDDGFHDIIGKIIIHHINPISPKDISDQNLNVLLNPDNVICVSHNTHEAIHYGDISLIPLYEERRMNDTTPWK